MASLRARVGVVGMASIATLLGATPLRAQAWNYPSFQPPRITTREFNFAVADGGWGGTSLLFQWREPFGARTQLSLDAGFAEPEPDAADTYALLGGQFGYQMMSASADMPLDLVLTAGMFTAIGEANIFRIPVGVSLGHRFALERTMAITPYVHPRVVYDYCNDCAAGESDSEVGLNVDLGADFEFNRQLSLRLGATLSGSEWFDNDGAIGLSLAWSPARIARR